MAGLHLQALLVGETFPGQRVKRFVCIRQWYWNRTCASMGAQGTPPHLSGWKSSGARMRLFTSSGQASRRSTLRELFHQVEGEGGATYLFRMEKAIVGIKPGDFQGGCHVLTEQGEPKLRQVR